MTSYAQQRDPARSAAGLSLVVLLHVILIWALIAGLGHRVFQAPRDIQATTIMPNVKRAPEPLPPPQQFRPVTQPRFSIPLPVVPPAVAPSPRAPTITATASPQPPQPFKAAVPAPPVQDTNVLPSAMTGELPAYPEDALEADLEGTAIIKCDVGVDGTTSNCSLVSVKGEAEVGSAALQFVRSHKLHPATHNGVAVKTAGAIIPYRFKLTDAQ